jgi:DNA invertase Pin-like site-specific DNA recombinase
MSKRIGYARVSTSDQDLSVQRKALKKAECGVVFEEKASGTKRTGRTELEKLLGILGKGDAVVVTRLDRLGRSLRDLANIADEISDAGAHLVVTEQSVDTSTSAGRAFFGMLATFAQFETDVRRERQMEGIDAAKAKGVYKGRRPSVDRKAVVELTEAGKNPTDIARELGIGRTSVYRVLAERTN